MTRPLCIVIACVLGCSQGSITPDAKSGRGRSAIRDGEFLRAHADELRLGDRPVRFVGVNAAAVHGRTTRETMPRLFESIAADSLTITRVWALGESEGDEAWRREVAFRTGPDAWVEQSFEHLDQLLAEARARDVRVVLVLANRWGDRGGLPQYARWAGIEPRHRNLLPSEEAAVLANERVQDLYLAHVERIVTRHNASTDVDYDTDPTIASWELFNEMGARTCAMQEALVPWIRRTAARIRELDPNHLIAAGHIGYNSEQSLRFWREIHTLDEIGYADTHGYPQNLLEASSPDRLGAWLGHRAAEARRLQKPLIVGEIGVPRNDARFDRVAWIDRFVHHADRNGTDGVLVWIYRSDERDDPHGIWSWGPFADETAPVRNVLTDWSKRWLRNDAELDPHALDDFPLGLEGIRPYVRGDQEGEELVVDPWQLAEGCVLAEEDAWVEYVIPWSHTHESFTFTFGEARHGRVRVELDRTNVGTWAEGRFERSDEDLPTGGWAWLRLEAEDEAGRSILRAFTRQLPASETIRIRAE